MADPAVGSEGTCACRSAGAVLVYVEVEAAAPGAGAGAGAAAQPAPPAGPARRWLRTRSWTLVGAREPWAKGLLLLGCAAAALAAVVAMVLPSAQASMELLLAAAAQLLAATVALRVQVTPVNLAAWVLGGQTGFRAVAILGAMASCHGNLDGALAVYYWITLAMVWVLFIVGVPVSFRRRRDEC